MVSINTPAHGTVVNIGSGFNYTPNPGFSGIEQITYTIRDNHGLTANGLATVWVDTGVTGPDIARPCWWTTSTSTKAPRSL